VFREILPARREIFPLERIEEKRIEGGEGTGRAFRKPGRTRPSSPPPKDEGRRCRAAIKVALAVLCEPPMGY